MTRWMILTLGLAIAAGTLYLLASGSGERGEIGDASRARMERVLRDADREARK